MAGKEDLNRLLSIKVNVAKRIAKDLGSYQKEAESLKQTIAGFEPVEGGEQEARKQQLLRSYDETVRMLPECRQRLDAAKADLSKFLSNCQEPLDPTISAEAQELLSLSD